MDKEKNQLRPLSSDEIFEKLRREEPPFEEDSTTINASTGATEKIDTAAINDRLKKITDQEDEQLDSTQEYNPDLLNQLPGLDAEANHDDLRVELNVLDLEVEVVPRQVEYTPILDQAIKLYEQESIAERLKLDPEAISYEFDAFAQVIFGYGLKILFEEDSILLDFFTQTEATVRAELRRSYWGIEQVATILQFRMLGLALIANGQTMIVPTQEL